VLAPHARLPEWTCEFFGGWNTAAANAESEAFPASDPRGAVTQRMLNFRWSDGTTRAGIPTDCRALRAFRTVPAGPQLVRCLANGAVRIFLDDQLLLDQWSATSDFDETREFLAKAGQTLRVEFARRDPTLQLQVAIWSTAP
jgi:hypothetical protein